VELEFLRDGVLVRVTSEQRDGRAHITVGDVELVVESFTIDARQIRLVTSDGQHLRLPYSRSNGRLLVSLEGRAMEISPHSGETEDEACLAGGFTPEVIAPMPGKVLEVLVAAGDQVAHDAPLLRLEAMKMEQTIRAASPARIREVRVTVGAMVAPGAVLFLLAPLSGEPAKNK
jgi:3-methylcrotonyl-CoA carboxylase alpha subunit